VLIYCAGKGMLTCPTVIPWLVLAFSRGEDREEGGGGGEGIRETGKRQHRRQHFHIIQWKNCDFWYIKKMKAHSSHVPFSTTLLYLQRNNM